ncbi:hypothetical protein [Rhodonellum sp.]|uniref:hypothetical protein n=1 Tax=Rhodonellum sp. TaxID=2231180 RepID=UPI002722EEE7|nr:hypothetical protein [Rhodonellum sp.]MDO9554618.1 hypothetical protein [Rhodonellum sp.]
MSTHSFIQTTGEIMKQTKTDYFFTILFLLISAKASFLYEFDVFWFVFSFSYLSYGLYKKRIYETDLYFFVGFAGIFLGYILFRDLFFNKLGISYLLSDVFFLLKFIFLAYIFCVVTKKNATYLISKVIIQFAKISLVLYLFQLVGGGEILYAIGKTFHNNILPYSGISDTYSNFLIFTYDKVHAIRNSGFLWEPGAYGCFLIIALLFYFMNNHFSIDRNVIIVIIAIITTLSTTAYLALAVLMLLYYRYNGGIINLKMILFFIFGILLFTFLPFLGDKIGATYESDLKILDDYDEINNQLEYYSEYGGEVKLNRFSSIVFLYRDFGCQLMFGISNAYVKLKSSVYGVEISKFNISNGIIDFIVKFGLIGFIFSLFRIGQFIYLHYNKFEFSFYIILMILIMNFGSPIFILPITLIFLFLSRFSMIEDEFEENEETEEI